MPFEKCRIVLRAEADGADPPGSRYTRKHVRGVRKHWQDRWTFGAHTCWFGVATAESTDEDQHAVFGNRVATIVVAIPPYRPMADEVTPDAFSSMEYISEDDLDSFEGWLRYQAIDLAALGEEQAIELRAMFDEAVARRNAARKMARINLTRPGDDLYAVAIPDGANLWLALWIKRSKKGEYFIIHPQPDGDWNPHTSLHADGTFHLKSHDRPTITRQKQRPNAVKGSEHLGAYMGFAPKSICAVCDPTDFRDVFVAPPKILGPRNGVVVVDLLEHADAEPLVHPGAEVARHLFTQAVPHILIRIFR